MISSFSSIEFDVEVSSPQDTIQEVITISNNINNSFFMIIFLSKATLPFNLLKDSEKLYHCVNMDPNQQYYIEIGKKITEKTLYMNVPLHIGGAQERKIQKEVN